VIQTMAAIQAAQEPYAIGGLQVKYALNLITAEKPGDCPQAANLPIGALILSGWTQTGLCCAIGMKDTALQDARNGALARAEDIALSVEYGIKIQQSWNQ